MTDGPPQSLPSDNSEREHSHAADVNSHDAHLTHAAAALNRHNAALNNDLPTAFATSATDNSNSDPLTSNTLLPAAAATATTHIQFRSNTIAPSPPSTSTSHSPDSLSGKAHHHQHHQHPSPLAQYGTPLRLQTETNPSTPGHDYFLSSTNSLSAGRRGSGVKHKTSSSSLRPVSRTPSLKTALANSLGTASAASSTFPSPIISAMGDVTPLPSPLLFSDSPGPWKRLGGRRPSTEHSQHLSPDSVLVASNGESIASALSHAAKRKAYNKLAPPAEEDGSGLQRASSGAAQSQDQQTHARNRSVSEYIPDPTLIPKRQITVSGSHMRPIEIAESSLEPHIRRELNLAEARGLTPTMTQPPTPPPSESSRDSTDATTSTKTKSSQREYFEAYGRHDGKKRRWRALKLLGQGTFSRVMLATSQMSNEDDEHSSSLKPDALTPFDFNVSRKSLVAVKVCEHGPRGGASEDRIEMSLKRELEIMLSIHHPSLIDLKAWSIEPTRAILVLSYCSGGDLFDVATTHRDVLTPALLRRLFAELVGAVRYLHERRIVHRDIKLESTSYDFTPLICPYIQLFREGPAVAN
jgi:protein-serine/threonine kinase